MRKTAFAVAATLLACASATTSADARPARDESWNPFVMQSKSAVGESRAPARWLAQPLRLASAPRPAGPVRRTPSSGSGQHGLLQRRPPCRRPASARLVRLVDAHTARWRCPPQRGLELEQVGPSERSAGRRGRRLAPSRRRDRRPCAERQVARSLRQRRRRRSHASPVGCRRRVPRRLIGRRTVSLQRAAAGYRTAAFLPMAF